VGARLAPEALRRVLHGDHSPKRANLSVRMPDFGETYAEKLGEALMAADKSAK